MLINHEKSNNVIFNFTDNYKFTTRLQVNSKPLEVLNKTKLLGTIIQDDLKWDSNTSRLVKKANARMQILREAVSFGASIEDLTIIYFSYIRSKRSNLPLFVIAV